MEFKVIVDAKARAATGCAVVGVYENGELGAATRHLDAQLGGLIARLHAAGDFAAKLGDSLLLPHPQGVAAQRRAAARPRGACRHSGASNTARP